MNLSKNSIVLVGLFVLYLATGCESIRCYQCSTDTDKKGEDLCGAYEKFDKTVNIAIDCNDEDSKMPGSFCVKRTEQSPRGFIWDGRWRQVIRRCASVASTGVTDVCNWGVNENGVYWQECYCSKDFCNNATTLSSSLAISIIALVGLLSIHFMT